MKTDIKKATDEILAIAKELDIELAKKVLKEAGFYVDNLWNISDIIDNYTEQDGSIVSDDKAYKILNDTFNDEWVIGIISDDIYDQCRYKKGNNLKQN